MGFGGTFGSLKVHGTNEAWAQCVTGTLIASCFLESVMHNGSIILTWDNLNLLIFDRAAFERGCF